MGVQNLEQQIDEKSKAIKELEASLELKVRQYNEFLILTNTINSASISLKAIINSEEMEIYNYLISCLYYKTSQYIFTNPTMICTQVALSSFLQAGNYDVQTWYHYNKLYIDFLLADKNTRIPYCVIEYHGKGHYGEDTNEKVKQNIEKNDAIKKSIFDKINLKTIYLQPKQEHPDFNTYIREMLLEANIIIKKT